jgi:16S rRNA U516 pseudouridylate synthase RsuA-like enzyme
MTSKRKQRAFSYVLASAAPLEAENAAGIGLLFKDNDRRTVTTITQALGDSTVEEATYVALKMVLAEARRQRVRRFTIYLDNPVVIQQLAREAPVPAELLADHLQVRALLHAAGSVQVTQAMSGGNFSARILALGATPDLHPSEHGRAPVQLQLLGDAVVA